MTTTTDLIFEVAEMMANLMREGIRVDFLDRFIRRIHETKSAGSLFNAHVKGVGKRGRGIL